MSVSCYSGLNLLLCDHFLDKNDSKLSLLLLSIHFRLN